MEHDINLHCVQYLTDPTFIRFELYIGDLNLTDFTSEKFASIVYDMIYNWHKQHYEL